MSNFPNATLKQRRTAAARLLWLFQHPPLIAQNRVICFSHLICKIQTKEIIGAQPAQGNRQGLQRGGGVVCVCAAPRSSPLISNRDLEASWSLLSPSNKPGHPGAQEQCSTRALRDLPSTAALPCRHVDSNNVSNNITPTAGKNAHSLPCK